MIIYAVSKETLETQNYRKLVHVSVRSAVVKMFTASFRAWQQKWHLVDATQVLTPLGLDEKFKKSPDKSSDITCLTHGVISADMLTLSESLIESIV